jgi:hypothetical protein
MTTVTIEAAKVLNPVPSYLARPVQGGGGTQAARTCATINFPWNTLTQGAQGVTAPSHRTWHIVTAVDGARIHVENLHGSDVYADGYLVGGGLRLGRITGSGEDERYDEVAVSVIAVSAARRLSAVRGMGLDRMLPPGTTSVTFGWENWHRPSAPEYIGVAAIDGTGARSAYATVAVTTPANPGGTPAAITTIAQTGAGAVGAIAAPTGVACTLDGGGQTHTLTWTAVPGAAGYVVRRSQYASFDEASWLEAEDPVAAQVGDLVIVEKPLDGTVLKEDWVANRVWNAGEGIGYGPRGLWPDPAGLSWTYGEEDGIPHISYTVTGSGTAELVRRTHTADADDSRREVIEPGVNYANRIVARSAQANAATISVERVDVGATAALTLSTDWTTQAPVFSRTTLDTVFGNYETTLTLQGPCTVDIRSWLTMDARYPALGPRGRQRDALAAAAPLRGHHTCKTNPRSYDARGLITSPLRLHVLLANAVALGHDSVWVQIEPHMSASEWGQIVEYLCTPYDPATDTPAGKPSAHARYAQGRTAPWTDDLHVFFEIGNELWQGGQIPEFYSMPEISGRGRARSAGLLGNWVKTQLRAHRDWQQDRFTWVAGGWNGQNGTWNIPLAAATDDQMPVLFCVADYNGGWDNGRFLPQPDVPDHWRRVLSNSALTGRRDIADGLVAIAAPRGWQVGTYEAGPGYQLNGLNGATVSSEERILQSRMMKSVGIGATTFAAFLTNVAAGFDGPLNFFTVGAERDSATWDSHSPRHRGEAETAPWLWCGRFWNAHVAGGRVRDLRIGRQDLSSATVTQDLPEVLGWDVLHVDRRYIVLVNTAIDGPRSVLVPDVGATTATRWSLTGADYADHNMTATKSGDVVLTSETVALTGGDIVADVPAGVAWVYEVAL